MDIVKNQRQLYKSFVKFQVKNLNSFNKRITKKEGAEVLPQLLLN
mgnify:CR=1 FL=1